MTDSSCIATTCFQWCMQFEDGSFEDAPARLALGADVLPVVTRISGLPTVRGELKQVSYPNSATTGSNIFTDPVTYKYTRASQVASVDETLSGVASMPGHVTT